MVIKKKRALTKSSKLTKLTSQAHNLTLQKAKQAQKTLKKKILDLKAEFKEKLRVISSEAYEKALIKVTETERKRTLAKSKALAAAEAKFEKQYGRRPASKAKSIKPRKTKRKVETGI